MATKPLVDVKSPLGITGIFLSLIRERFNIRQGLPWVWFSESGFASQNEETSGSGTVAGNKCSGSQILIEADQSESESRNQRPAIYVTRGPVPFSNIVIDDKHDQSLRTGVETSYCQADTTIYLKCVAQKAGEADLIADIVANLFVMSANIIERTFNFRKVAPVVIGARAKESKDSVVTSITVTVGVSYDVKWLNAVYAPLIKEIVIKAKAEQSGNEEYFEHIYKNSLTRESL